MKKAGQILLKQMSSISVALVILSSSIRADTVIWTGAGGDGFFSTVTNWSNNPVGVNSGDTLQLGLDAGPVPHYFAPDFGGIFNTPSITFLPTASAYLMIGASPDDILNITSTGTAILNQSSNRQTSQNLTINVGAATQTWDGGASGLSISNIFLGNNRTLTFTGTGVLSTTRNEITAGIDGTGTSGLTKAGTGTLVLSGSASYVGATTVNDGILQLGASNRIANTSNLVLNGGTFSTGGFDETVGKLSLTNFSTIDFGNSNTSDLVFSLSSDLSWGSFTLNIINFTPGLDTLRFGTNASGLTSAQLLNNIRFNGTTAGQIDSLGFVTLVPEPSVFGLALLSGIGLICGWRRRVRQT